MTNTGKYILMLAFGVLFGLLASGVILLVARQPQGQPFVLHAAPPPAPLRVHVGGEVIHPGVYSLEEGSRVEDAVLAAGGFSELAAQEAINLAAPVKDGSQIIVPAQGGGSKKFMPVERTRLDINAADQADLEGLPGIGPVIAENILKYREENGYFTSVEAIQEVPGIGPAIYEQIKDLITVQ